MMSHKQNEVAILWIVSQVTRQVFDQRHKQKNNYCRMSIRVSWGNADRIDMDVQEWEFQKYFPQRIIPLLLYNNLPSQYSNFLLSAYLYHYYTNIYIDLDRVYLHKLVVVLGEWEPEPHTLIADNKLTICQLYTSRDSQEVVMNPAKKRAL